MPSVGMKTSEFKVTAVIALLAAYLEQTGTDIHLKLAAILCIGAVATAYVLSRGFAKQGPSDGTGTNGQQPPTTPTPTG